MHWICKSFPTVSMFQLLKPFLSFIFSLEEKSVFSLERHVFVYLTGLPSWDLHSLCKYWNAFLVPSMLLLPTLLPITRHQTPEWYRVNVVLYFAHSSACCYSLNTAYVYFGLNASSLFHVNYALQDNKLLFKLGCWPGENYSREMVART